MGSNYSDQNDPFGVNRMYDAMRECNEKIYGGEARVGADSNEQNRDNIPVADVEIIEDANRSDAPYSAIGKLFRSIGGKIAVMILVLLVLFVIALPALMGLIAILIDLAIVGGIIWLVCWGIRKVLSSGSRESDDERG